MTKPIYFLILFCLLLNACGPSKAERRRIQIEALKSRTLTTQEKFYYVWAEVISRTAAVNKKATQIIKEEGLREGDPLPPSMLEIKNAPEENEPEDEEYDLFLECEIDGKIVPFWVHIFNIVPPPLVNIAFASTIDPTTGKVVLYPRTQDTQAMMQLALLKIRNNQKEIFLSKWKAEEAAFQAKKRKKAKK